MAPTPGWESPFQSARICPPPGRFRSSVPKDSRKSCSLSATTLLKKLRVQIENTLNMLIEFRIVGFDGSILKILDPLVHAMIWICGIEFDIPISLPRIAVLQAKRIFLVPFASAQKVGVIEIFARVQVLTVPVGNLHRWEESRFSGANAAKTVAT